MSTKKKAAYHSEDIKENPMVLLAQNRQTVKEFEALLPVFEEAYNSSIQKHFIDAFEKRKKIWGLL
jgi:hypothetical protein